MLRQEDPCPRTEGSQGLALACHVGEKSQVELVKKGVLGPVATPGPGGGRVNQGQNLSSEPHLPLGLPQASSCLKNATAGGLPDPGTNAAMGCRALHSRARLFQGVWPQTRNPWGGTCQTTSAHTGGTR